MRTQTRLILCAAICALALLAPALIPLGTQGKSTPVLQVAAEIETDSEPQQNKQWICPPLNDPKDPNKPIDMKGVLSITDLKDATARELEDTLRDLRCRKRDDLARGCTSQSYLRQKLVLVKAAIRRLPAISVDDVAIDDILDEDCPPKAAGTTPSGTGAGGAGTGGTGSGGTGPGGTGPGGTGPGATESGDTKSGSTKSGNGLKTVAFDTPPGRVTVNLPANMMAGDTISGTVFTEPKGNTPEEKAKNQDQLNGYVVEYAGTKTPASQPSFKWTLSEPPPSQPRYQLRIIDIPTSRTIATAEITPYPKITQTAPTSSANITLPIPRVNIPSLGQGGKPIVVSGNFDGDSSNTSFNWTVAGSTPSGLTVLAESQGEAVVAAPTNVVGLIEIHLKEGGVEASGQFRNVAVDLTAPKTSLRKGESTELRVQVNGLEGIKEPVPLTLECKGVVTMTGGNYQPLTIQPSQVGADGSYSTTRGITGVQAGGWGATATVVTRPFNVCLQDDSRAATVILWNTVSGDYSFRPSGGSSAPQTGGASTTGKGTMVMKGCILTLTHNAPDRRVFAKLDTCTSAGSAGVEMPASKEKFTITDRNTADNTCAGQ